MHLQRRETLAKSALTPGCMQAPPASHKSPIPCPVICRATISAIFSYTGFTTGQISPAWRRLYCSASSSPMPRFPPESGDMVSAGGFIRRIRHPALFNDGDPGGAAADVHHRHYRAAADPPPRWLIQHMTDLQPGGLRDVDRNARIGAGGNEVAACAKRQPSCCSRVAR